jgi:HK97 family phage portal protein
MFEWFKQVIKRSFYPNWKTLSGFRGGYYYDGYRHKKEPDAMELCRLALQSHVYACESLIAERIAETKLRLLVETLPGQQHPKCLTVPCKGGRKRGLVCKAVETREVVDHQVLDLLYRANDVHNFLDLIEITNVYLDFVGNSYWLIRFDADGYPCELYVLPSWAVTPLTKDNGEGIIIGYEYEAGGVKKTYSVEEIIHFTSMKDPMNPYSSGLAPLRACYDEVMVGLAQLGYINQTLQNAAKPSLLASPKNPMNSDDAERLAKEFFQRHSHTGIGGIHVATDPVDLTVINYNPRDVAELKILDMVRNAVCVTFRVPPNSLMLQDSNLASAKVAQYNLAVNAIQPRLIRILEKINSDLIARYYSDRLFLEAVDVVPADEAEDHKVAMDELDRGAITINEYRQDKGLASVAWGDEPLKKAESPQDEEEQPEHEEPLKINETKGGKALLGKPFRASIQGLAETISKYFRRQEQLVLHRLTTKAVGSVYDLSATTPDFVESVLPSLKLFAQEGAEQGAAEVYEASKNEGVWEALRVVQPKLAEAVQAHAYIFCDQVNESTALSLQEAEDSLKEELTEGLQAGERQNAIMERVKGIYDELSTQHSYLIAHTESMRATHSAMIQVGKENGVADGKKWIASDDACDQCQELDGVVVGLDDPFVTDGEGPYASVECAPRHPGCRCTNSLYVKEDQ